MRTFASSKVIYLDHHSTTPMDPHVLREMVPYFVHRFANAASFTHSAGRDAGAKVEQARRQVAQLIGADPREIIFTSGATESNNLAIKGTAEARRSFGRHLVTITTEHKSVLDPHKRLASRGFKVTYLPVEQSGLADLKKVEKSLTPKTILISVMLANNEIGVIQPVKQIVQMAHKKGIRVHCDATQAVGRIPVDVHTLGVDLLSFTAHKIYGPKGVGALYIRKRGEQIKLIPILDGGGHETGLRSGTLNVPGIVGFAAACRIAQKRLSTEPGSLRKLRDEMAAYFLEHIPEAVIHGSMERRLPNNLNISFPGVEATRLMASLPQIALSSGSACTSTSIEPSYVLKALGVSEPLRRSSIRIGLGRFLKAEDTRAASRLIVQQVKKIRDMV